MNLALLFFLAQTQAPAAAKPDAGLGGIQMMVWMAFAFALIYFMSIRPQARKQKELQNRIASIKTGDKVVTTGGIHGVVSNVKDGPTLVLKIADNVKIEIDKTSVAIVAGNGNGKGEAPAPEAKA